MRVKFKSTQENYRKEFLGLKRNTFRIRDYNTRLKDIRFEILDKWIKGKYNNLTIEIINAKTNESFVREITDVTEYESWYIISW